MMLRTTPPVIKIYEALGAIADDRIEIVGSGAKVWSSSKNKYYSVCYDETQNAIMSNDNGSYRKGYLGYPAIALLMIKDILPFNQEFADALKDIARKDRNTKNQNDFEKTLQQVYDHVASQGVDILHLQNFATACLQKVKKLRLYYLGKKNKTSFRLLNNPIRLQFPLIPKIANFCAM